ncbi:hypothetical protein CBR_g17654 [Chara braunii]|uniref:Uncharacterized protein n=1 Tax=Chara braunii TaxID=69332 RepID=A0A388KV57_CHABU|nr:hypothetical protein CBR_g17654 [Chara braunii]|eukprot:GBG73939.1 hypothetical protein CBR_g17654 [Chara braunii]
MSAQLWAISIFCLATCHCNGGQNGSGTGATPLLTLPANNNSGVGTVAPAQTYSGQGNGSGWLGKRVYTLEERVVKIRQQHEAEEAREKARKEEEERTKRKQEEDERLEREKKERVEFQKSIKQELADSLSKVYLAIDGKKKGEPDELEKLRSTVEGLQQRIAGGSTSTDKSHEAAVGELARIRREQADLKVDSDKRLSALEEVVMALQRQCEEAEATAERWKAEALRPGNKRGSIAVGATPISQARVRTRLGGAESPKGHIETPRRHVEVDLKGIVERYQMEVEALQTLRINEMNARKELELEVEKLKESLARLEMEKRISMRGTNLKARMDEAAANKDKTYGGIRSDVGTSARKTGEKESNVATNSDDWDTFVRANRKDLRGRNKDFVMKICEKEGVEYTTLDPTKEAIVQARAAKVFDDEGRKGKKAVTVMVSDDGEGQAATEERDDFAAS